MKRLFNCIHTIPLLIPFILLYPFIGGKKKDLLLQDLSRWCAWKKQSVSLWNFLFLFSSLKEFRNIVYKRIGHISTLISWIWPRQTNLAIACDNIGPGMIIQHGYSTVIVAEKIGKNFQVNQCVNIVWNGNKRAVIGDNVSVCAGAIIVGGVHIGNNVIVGAGAVVTKDIPDNCTVVGNPGRIISNNKNDK